MKLLPVPQKVTETKKGFFHLKWNTKIVLQNTEPSAFLYAQMLQKAADDYAGMKLSILQGVPRLGDVVLKINSQLPADYYTLHISTTALEVAGGSDESLLHGTMTLVQLVQQYGAVLPDVEIEDYPQFPQRGYYQDLARGRIPSLEQLKKTADLLCQYKINEWQLYIEHTYMFRDFSEAWRDDTPLTAEDIMELDRYCAARHIELVPSLSTFGHMYTILSTKTYSHLCEIPDSDKVSFSFSNTMAHHTISVSSPDAMATVKSMILEYMKLFSSKKFNICCDETFDLGKARSKWMADEKGEHTLYISYVAELCSWLIDMGITPQFWGDILLRHPEDAGIIPSGTICLNWDYNGDVKEDSVKTVAETHIAQYVCPGIHNWGTYIPRFQESFNNIKQMCCHGAKYGAVGLLNTDWGDYGAVCPPDLAIPGIIYGAEFGWNTCSLSFGEINEAISALAFGDNKGEIMQAMVELSGNDVLTWRSFCLLDEARTDEKRQHILEKLDMSALIQANNRIESGLRILDEASLSVTRHREVIWQLRVCAEAVCLINKVAICALEKMGNKDLTVCPSKLACEIENWLAVYSQQWRSVSKESMLRHVQDTFIRCADALRGREIILDSSYLDKYLSW